MEEIKLRDIKVSGVQRNTLSRQILEQIIDMLMNGELKAGVKLPSELELMNDFGVSRPVLREALSSLETLEIVTRKPRGGTIVNEKIGSAPFRAMLALAINDVEAIIEARMALELGMVTLAAEKIKDSELEELKKVNDKIRQSVSNDYGQYDIQFHKIIGKSAENSVIQGMMDALLMVHEKTDSLIPYREKEKTINFHENIYQALLKRDPVSAYKHMYEHLSDVRTKILSRNDIKK